MSVFDKGLITVLICNAAFVLVSIPLILRKVPRNPVYGYRTRLTLSDDALWYEINAYFASRLLIASLVSVCIAVAVHQWQGLSPPVSMKANVILLASPAVAAWLLTVRFIRSTNVGGRASEANP